MKNTFGRNRWDAGNGSRLLILVQCSCSCGPMAKACDYESRDWGFESLQECFFTEIPRIVSEMSVGWSQIFRCKNILRMYHVKSMRPL